MTAADLILYALIALVILGALALLALPFVWVIGNRRIDAIDARIRMDRDHAESVTNVRTLSRWELARRMERKNR